MAEAIANAMAEGLLTGVRIIGAALGVFLGVAFFGAIGAGIGLLLSEDRGVKRGEKRKREPMPGNVRKMRI